MTWEFGRRFTWTASGGRHAEPSSEQLRHGAAFPQQPDLQRHRLDVGLSQKAKGTRERSPAGILEVPDVGHRRNAVFGHVDPASGLLDDDVPVLRHASAGRVPGDGSIEPDAVEPDAVEAEPDR